MAKSTSKRPEKAVAKKPKDTPFIAVDKKSVDPGLASLFASSSGPVKQPPKSRYETVIKQSTADDLSEADEESEDDASSTADSEEREDGQESGSDSDDAEALEADDSDLSEDNEAASDESESDADVLAKVQESVLSGAQDRSNKKRKRGDKDDDLENAYMQKLAREEVKDDEKRKKKAKTEASKKQDEDEDEQDENMEEAQSNADDSDDESFVIPKHETQVDSADNDKVEMEKAARTVFLGNVSSEAVVSKSAKKTLMRHLGSFIEDLADNKPPHKVESIRFRSTAFASALPKKAAFAKKEIMDATTKSTNAYVVYTTKVAAREAAKRLNGSVVLGRHLRVDSVAHPAPTDHRRCVFVGNLGFVDDESQINAADGEKRKNRPPGDAEEGLWVEFTKVGNVESVRVVRDSKTRVGKGFAYVQFADENGVEAALQLNDQKFPPLLPRKLRVVRAKAQKRKKPAATPPRPAASNVKGAYKAKATEEQKTSQGRARSMLGKAGAFKSAESFVFEGHRASSKQGKSGLKLGGKGGKKKGPNGRKSRSSSWKSSGGKK